MPLEIEDLRIAEELERQIQAAFAANDIAERLRQGLKQFVGKPIDAAALQEAHNKAMELLRDNLLPPEVKVVVTVHPSNPSSLVLEIQNVPVETSDPGPHYRLL